MRELEVRSLRHSAALGDPGAEQAAILLATNIVNPALASVAEPPRSPPNHNAR